MPKTLPNIKEEILETTRRMVLEKGYNKISIRDIAKECGIATGTFYNYFRSKQAIVSATLAEDWAMMTKMIKMRTKVDMPPVKQLETVFFELKHMMNQVHQLWEEGLPDNFESETMNKMQRIKTQLRIDFAGTVRDIIHGHVEPEREEFLSEFISRVFFTYAYKKDSDFDDMRFVLEKFIK